MEILIECIRISSIDGIQFFVVPWWLDQLRIWYQYGYDTKDRNMLRLKRCVVELLEMGSPKVFASWMLIKRALHPVNRFETERCWVVSDDTFVDACLPEAFFSAGAFLLSRTQQRFLERNPEKAQWENVKMAIWDDWGLHFSAFNKWIIAGQFCEVT